MTATIRVAVVDDDTDVRVLVRVLLEDAGCEIVGEAPTADAGIDVVAQCSPDVVVLDGRMPGRSGQDAIGELRQAAPHAAIVIFSSVAGGVGLAQSLDAGADGYVDKSDPSGLVRFVADHARHRSTLITECEHWRSVADAHAAAGRWEAARQYYELVEAVSAELAHDTPLRATTA
jgi:DNA-binding NarL/FixJ family response regulator